MKVCTKCKTPKPATKHFFYIERGKPKSECMECSRQRAIKLYRHGKKVIILPKKESPEWIDREYPATFIVAQLYKQPDITEKEIEFNVERKLNCKPNPSFFYWLCAGSNQKFIP